MKILEEGPITELEIYGDENGLIGVREVLTKKNIERKEYQDG